MRVAFGNWKYLFKNFGYVLICGLVPAIFLALSFDYTAISSVLHGFLSGNPLAMRGPGKLNLFLQFLSAFGPIRIDSVLDGVYTVLAYVLSSLFASLLLALVEKHMRIGKRSFSGMGTEMRHLLLPTFLIVLLFYALGETSAIILSALLFMIFSLNATAIVYLLSILAMLVIFFLFLYVFEVFYLWLPCMQITCFRPYHAFLYSYRLSMGVRWKLIGAHALSIVVAVVVLGGMAFLPELAFRSSALVVSLLLFAGMFIRMETVYFATDKLDREDIIQSYKEL